MSFQLILNNYNFSFMVVGWGVYIEE